MSNSRASSSLPLIDISPLIANTAEKTKTARQIGEACKKVGFFYITGTGLSESLLSELEVASRKFFALSLEEKMAISMDHGGRAWRGYFPLGGELTSGKPDGKEGIYFGAELDALHPAVQAQTPLHGANLFPKRPSELKSLVLCYLEEMTKLAHAVMGGIALSLGLEQDFFFKKYTSDPLILFRIFNYPANFDSGSWGVGEHTDYGLLTILKQDETGGLEVKTRAGWRDAPPLPGSFICNIGDMLDRMTGGLYKSTPHRVKNSSNQNRVSFPFFFDPNFSAWIEPIALSQSVSQTDEDRWDRENLSEFRGTYGEYLLKKVGKVFPDLREDVL